MSLADWLHFVLLDRGFVVSIEDFLEVCELIMYFLFLLRVIVILASMFSNKRIVIDLQVYVDVSSLLKVQGVVFAMFWGWPQFATEGGRQGYVAKFCLYFFRENDVFCLKVIVDVAGHVCYPGMMHDFIDTWSLISLEL